MPVIIVKGAETSVPQQLAEPRRYQFLLPRFQVESENAVCQLTDLFKFLPVSGRIVSCAARTGVSVLVRRI